MNKNSVERLSKPRSSKSQAAGIVDLLSCNSDKTCTNPRSGLEAKEQFCHPHPMNTILLSPRKPTSQDEDRGCISRPPSSRLTIPSPSSRRMYTCGVQTYLTCNEGAIHLHVLNSNRVHISFFKKRAFLIISIQYVKWRSQWI